MKRIFHWLGEPIEVCDCDCHDTSMIVRHIVACCDVCYKQFITEGKADIDLLNKALEVTYNRRKENGYLQQKPEEV